MSRSAARGLHAALVLVGLVLYLMFVLPRWWVLTGDIPTGLATAGRLAAGIPIALAALPVLTILRDTLAGKARVPELALRLRAWSAVLHLVAGGLILLAAIAEIWLRLGVGGPYLFAVYGAAAAIAILAVLALYLSFVAEKPPAPSKPAEPAKPGKVKAGKVKAGKKSRRDRGAQTPETQEPETQEPETQKPETGAPTETDAQTMIATEPGALHDGALHDGALHDGDLADGDLADATEPAAPAEPAEPSEQPGALRNKRPGRNRLRSGR